MMYSLLSLTLFLAGSLGQAPPAGAASSTAPATTAAGTTTSAAPLGPNTVSTTTTAAPIVVPPVTPPGNPEPPANPPATPPANPGTGNPPVVTPPTNPGSQQPPVTGQQPPATPQYGYPQPNPYMNPGFGAPGILDPQTLTCEFGQCRNRRITMTPGQGFKLECNMMRQCDNLDLTLNIGVDPTSFGNHVNEINDFIFDAPQNGVKITMNNMFPGQNIEVNNILCKKVGSCQNMQVTAGFGVELWEINMKCEMPGACTGCTINGQSCEMVSMMTGNHHGGITPGFGYMNTANVPGAGGAAPAPQQPGVGAPAPANPNLGAPQYPQYQQPQQYNPYQYQQPQYNPYQYNPYNPYNYWMWSQI